MRLKNLILGLLVLFGVSSTPISVYGQHSLSVDAPNVVALDEHFRVVFTADGKAQDFTLPTVEGFEVIAGPSTSTSSSTSFINGKRTHSYQHSFTYIFRPTAEGKFTIPSATVTIEGKSYSSKSFVIEVIKVKSGNTAANSSSGNNNQGIGEKDILLSMTVNKKRVVKGEPVIATIKLLTRANISGVENIKFPTFNGFWSQEMESPTTLEFVRETYNGEIYNSALLKKYMLLPQQVGTITIDPAEIVCAVQVRSNSPRNSFFDDFFDSYQTLKKRVFTDQVTIQVNSLPAGAPSSFSSGVGEYTMDVKLTRDSLTAHDAASLIVTISGSGNLNLIEPPKVSFPPDFEVYDVKRSDKLSTSAMGTSGTKTFEYPFIPRSPGDFEIEPIEFSFYNVKTHKYQTIKSSPKKIHVKRAVESGTPSLQAGVSKQSVKTLGGDIRYIKTSSPHLSKGERFFITSPLFYILLGAILLLFVATAFALEKSIAIRQDVVGRRTRKAKKVAKVRLKRGEIFLRQELYTAFYEELHKAILGYLSDKLAIPAGELNKELIGEKLKDKGCSEGLLELLNSLLDACEYARYAPSSGTVAMEKHYQDGVRIISEIESLR